MLRLFHIDDAPKIECITSENFPMIAAATDGMVPYFLTGTLNLFLIAVVIASVAYSFWMEVRNRRYLSKEEIMV